MNSQSKRIRIALRPRSTSVLRALLACSLLAVCSPVLNAGWFKAPPDFSNYDVPLQEQISNHIKAKVMARLGEGKSTRDRYFIIPFAYENRGNDPEFSHSFLSVIRVLADDKSSKVTPGLKKRSYRNRQFEAFTISWLPQDFTTNPSLCVFEGVGSRIFASRNKCPLSVGKNHTLEETIQLAVNARNAVCMWGPYEITKEAFDRGIRRIRLLEGGPSNTGPTTAFIEKTKPPSIASTRWPAWTSSIRTAGSSAPASTCGVSMARRECSSNTRARRARRDSSWSG
jgi:hypothetical protein